MQYYINRVRRTLSPSPTQDSNDCPRFPLQTKPSHRCPQAYANFQACSFIKPKTLGYLTQAVRCYFKAGWRSDGDVWNAFAIKAFGWTPTERAFVAHEQNPLPSWEGAESYAHLAEHCLYLAVQEVVIDENWESLRHVQPSAISLMRTCGESVREPVG